MTKTTANRASLRWSRPELENGAPISNFKIRYFPAGQEGSTKEIETGSGACEFTCPDLQPGTAYFFGVCAQNAAGWGLWAPLNAYGLTKSAPPARPENLRVIAATVNSVRLGWIRPVSNGSAVVLYEIIYEDSAGRSCSCVRQPGGAGQPPPPREHPPQSPAVDEEEQAVDDVAPGTCLSNIQVTRQGLLVHPAARAACRTGEARSRASLGPSRATRASPTRGARRTSSLRAAGSGQEPRRLGPLQPARVRRHPWHARRMGPRLRRPPLPLPLSLSLSLSLSPPPRLSPTASWRPSGRRDRPPRPPAPPSPAQRAPGQREGGEGRGGG